MRMVVVARRRITVASLALPWERQSSRLRDLLRSGRWRWVLGAVALAVVTAAIWQSADARERVRRTREGIAQVRRALVQFRLDVGRCPSSMRELVHPPRTGSRYLSEMPVDGWGHPLWVRCPGRYDPEDADVVSAGPSGNFLIDDNIQ